MYAEKLEERWLAEQEGRGRVLPDYGGYCLASVTRAVTSIIQGGTPKGGLEQFAASGEGKRVLLVMLDGLGYFQMKRRMERLPFFRRCVGEGQLLPVTTVFPSTTPAAVTTLHTGRTPAEHGLIEWNLYLREIEMIVESLPFVPKRPEDFARFEELNPSARMLFEGRTLYEKLGRKGCRSVVMQPRGISDSAYTRLISRGADRASYGDLSSAGRLLRTLLEKRYSLIHFYYPGIDTAGHGYGPGSEQYLAEMISIDSLLSRVSAAAEENGYTLIVTSDHGHVEVNPRDALFLEEMNGFDEKLKGDSSGIVQPYGSPRDVIIGAAGDSAAFTDWLSTRLEGTARVLRTEEMIEEGYFGATISGKGRERMADLWVLPEENGLVWYRHYPEERVEFRGMHGGASIEEMIVPLISK